MPVCTLLLRWRRGVERVPVVSALGRGGILQAREDAFALVAADPSLEEHPALRRVIGSVLDDEQAAYLERG